MEGILLNEVFQYKLFFLNNKPEAYLFIYLYFFILISFFLYLGCPYLLLL